MLSYEKFREEIRMRMEQGMGSGCHVDISSVRKENIGAQYSMAVFDKKSTGNRVSPNIYLEPLYQQYKEGMGLAEITEMAAAMYRKGMEGAQAVMESMPDIKRYESCRDRLYFRIVGTEKNRALLGEVPHYEVMDLSVIPYLMAGETESGINSVMVKDAMVKRWGVSAGTVLKQASANTPEMLPVMVDTIRSVMERILKESGGSVAGRRDIGETQTFPGVFPDTEEISEIFIMTNRKGLNGFATILYPGALKSAADRIGKDLYVVPSSTHEALLIPADCSIGAPGLLEMVQEVNETCVAEEEIVSDSVYFYNRKERKLCMAGEEGLCVRL